jgi:hypothetical protein
MNTFDIKLDNNLTLWEYNNQLGNEYILTTFNYHGGFEISFLQNRNLNRKLGAVRAKHTREMKKYSEAELYMKDGKYSQIDAKERRALKKLEGQLTKAIVYEDKVITDTIIIETFFSFYDGTWDGFFEAIEIARNI